MYNTDEYTKHANICRGEIISAFAMLEKTIEFFIGNYFMGETLRMADMMNILLDRMTFEAKRTSFKAIVESIETQNGFKKTKNNSFPNSKLFNEVRVLNDQRNYFAHYVLVIPNEDNGSVIGLGEFRDTMNVKWYTSKEYKDIINRIEAVTNSVRILHGQVNTLHSYTK